MGEIARRRLATQRLAGQPFAAATDAVGWLTAVQAQDYAGAKWALGLRTQAATDAGLDALLDAGAILRTHVMRPTWHFVLPGDVRWLLDLTAARVTAKMAPFDRREGVDADLVASSRKVLEAELRDGAARTRRELVSALELARVSESNWVAGRLLMQAELDALIVSGPRRGRQHTYMLLEARAPRARRLPREEALVELVRRYFGSHGPAQVLDCVWWSGLTAGDIRRGLALAGSALQEESIAGKKYWSAGAGRAPGRAPIGAHLLPNFDEYVVGYQDRTAILDPARGFERAAFPMGSILAHTVLLNGQVWGSWKRRSAEKDVLVDAFALDTLDREGAAAIAGAAEALGRFLQRPVSLTGLPSVF